MERRALGRTGVELSVVGFGAILVMDETAAEADRVVGSAIDRGINYFDVAPSYGNAETMLGPALERYRKDVFLACKTTERKKDAAAKELRESLGRLKTDHVDLYQMHALTSDEDIATAFGPGGAIEAFVEARQAGLARFLGFSAHSEKAALAAMERFAFDTVLFPFSRGSWHGGNFGPKVLEAAGKRGMGCLALKALGKRPLKDGEAKPWAKCWYAPVESYEEAVAGLRFSLSLPITAAVSPGHAQLFDWMCRAAESFTPLQPAEAAAERRDALELAPIFSVAG
jgi:aryl-alcohol dehydrogenase-like predicted oxidoreductase